MTREQKLPVQNNVTDYTSNKFKTAYFSRMTFCDEDKNINYLFIDVFSIQERKEKKSRKQQSRRLINSTNHNIPAQTKTSHYKIRTNKYHRSRLEAFQPFGKADNIWHSAQPSQAFAPMIDYTPESIPSIAQSSLDALRLIPTSNYNNKRQNGYNILNQPKQVVG